MKNFKSMVVAAAPLDRLWITVRDNLPDLITTMDDIEKVVVVERTQTTPDCIRLTNEWYAKMRVPEILRASVQGDVIGWTDRNEWNESDRTCRWSIEPWIMPGAIQCSGITRYEPAIGGLGTRVTFEGDFQLDKGALSGIAATLAMPLLPLIESIVTTLIPKNLRKVVEAAAKRPTTG
jgi:hypothetical protein